MEATSGLDSAPLEKAAFLEALNGRGDATAANDAGRGGVALGGLGNIGNDVAYESGEDAEEMDDDFDETLFVEGVHQPGGIIVPDHSHREVERVLGDQTQVRKIENVQREYMEKVTAAEDARSVLDHEEERLRDLRKLAAQPGSGIDAARLGYQEGEVAKAWSKLTETEKARDIAELALHRITDSGGRAARRTLQENMKHSNVSRARQLDEVSRATRIVQDDLRNRDATLERQRLESEERARREKEANRHQGKGVRRLEATHSEHDSKQKVAEMIRDSRFEKDAQKILTLKTSMDKINRQVRASNEKRNKKAQKQKLENEQRKKDLLDQGLNPYEVYRREEIEADKERQKMELEQRGALRSEKLIEQLLEEDKRYKKSKKEANQKRLETEDFQREMGNYAKEKRIAAYIRKMTIGNVDVLDPTGAALRIDPSKVTIQKTHRFGLGRGVSLEEIKKVDKDVRRAQHRADTWKPPRGPPEDDVGDLVGGGEQKAATLSGAGDSESLPEGKLWVPKLTKLEEQYLAAARERQKENLISVQRCWGKEFKGDAFLAKPSVIAFNDFEVGKKYRQVVEVTNVSFTFNHFKLLPLDDRIKEFFEIEFVPPGRQSAGVTRYITVWFLPRKPEDINNTFPILAKTGRIDFPLRCTTKKTILSLLPQDANANPIIDFKNVIKGEEGQAILTVKNTGALGAAFELEPQEESEFTSMVTYDKRKGEFPSHGTTVIRFTFKPTKLGDFKAILKLSINNGADGDARPILRPSPEGAEPLFLALPCAVLVRGSCVDVPIAVERKEYDMKTCIFDHIFRENIVLQNRSKTAMKCIVELPKPIEGELQLTPTLAFVQGQSEQAIAVKFKPKEDFLDRCHWYRDKSSETRGAFRIPVRVKGADQVEPVECTLVGTLTSNFISFEPKYLNFGRCFVGSSTVGRISVINESLLPQQFAFIRLPHYLSIADVPTDVIEEEDTDGCDSGTAVLDGGGSAQFGMLLPMERRELCVTYTPDSATELKYSMNFKAITGGLCVRDYALKCAGQGVNAILKLSHTQIDMTSIPCDASSIESIVITNTSKAPYMINLLAPPLELSALHISPVCCVLRPQEQRRIQIEFKPTREYIDLLRLPDKTEEAAKTDGDIAPDTEPPSLKERRREHRKLQLRAIRQNGGRRWESHPDSDGKAGDGIPAGGEGTEDPSGDGGDGAVGEGAEDAQDQIEQAEVGPTTVHTSWRLAICMRPHTGEQVKEQSLTELRRNATTYCGVRTCVLPTVLTADPPALDFGEVTAGQRQVIPVTLHNANADEVQDLHMEALPENACFTILNATRTVGSRPFKLAVEFKPERVQIYQSTLKLYTQNTRMQVPLCGRGVRPVLKIEPEDGIIHLGSIVYSKESKDYVQAKLEIKNSSPFELCYNLETVIAAEPNHVGPSPFTMTPSTGAVEGNGQKTVTVTFRPHRPLEVFKEKILVNVPNQKEPTYVYLYGHCFQFQGFALPQMYFSPFGRAAAQETNSFVDALAVGSGSNTSPEKEFTYQKSQRKEMSLVFERGETSKFILLGASSPPGTPFAVDAKGGAACNFDIQIAQSQFSNLFTVEMDMPGGKADKLAKGALQPGKPPIKAIFKYNPPEDTSLKCGDVMFDMLAGVGQWVTCTVRVELSGGFVPAPDPPTTKQEIIVELRAYLTQLFTK